MFSVMGTGDKQAQKYCILTVRVSHLMTFYESDLIATFKLPVGKYSTRSTNIHTQIKVVRYRL
jgi:hypothetical protein